MQEEVISRLRLLINNYQDKITEYISKQYELNNVLEANIESEKEEIVLALENDIAFVFSYVEYIMDMILPMSDESLSNLVYEKCKTEINRLNNAMGRYYWDYSKGKLNNFDITCRTIYQSITQYYNSAKLEAVIPIILLKTVNSRKNDFEKEKGEIDRLVNSFIFLPQSNDEEINQIIKKIDQYILKSYTRKGISINTTNYRYENYFQKYYETPHNVSSFLKIIMNADNQPSNLKNISVDDMFAKKQKKVSAGVRKRSKGEPLITVPYVDEHKGWSFYKWLIDKKQDKVIKRFKMNIMQVDVFMALLKAKDIKKNIGFSCYGINSYMRWFDYILYTDMYSELFDRGDLVNSIYIIGFSMKKYLISLNQRLNSLVAEKNRCEASAEPIPSGERKQNMNKPDSEMIFGNTIFLSDQDVTLFNHIITESVQQLLSSRSVKLNFKIAQEGAHAYDDIFKEYLNMDRDEILSKFTFKQYVNFAYELYN